MDTPMWAALAVSAVPLISQALMYLGQKAQIISHNATVEQLTRLHADLGQGLVDAASLAHGGKVVDALPKLVSDAQAVIGDVRDANAPAGAAAASAQASPPA